MRWTLISTATALGVTVLVFLIVWYPDNYKLWAAASLFGAVVVFMLLRNPAYRYMRMAWWLTAAWATTTAVPEITATLQINDVASGTFGLGNQQGWVFHFAFALSVLGCLALDYFAIRENSAIQLLFSRVHFRFGGQRQTVSGGTAIQVGDVSGQATVNVHQTDVNRELDHVKALLEKGKPDAAEEHLLRIKRDHDPSLTLQQQFRLQEYFGRVFHDRGEASKAALHFGNASKLRPDDEEGQAYGVLSEFMAGRTEQAHQSAIKLLRQHSGSSLATAILIRSAPADTKAAALLSQIDDSVKDEVDVLAALVVRFLSENDAATAEAYARRLLAKRPDHPAVVGNLGNAVVIDEANAAEQRFWEGPLEDSAKRRLGEAVGLLTTAIVSSRSPAEVRQFMSMRGLARELLRQFTEAEADYVAAVEGDRTCHDTTARYASFLSRRDRNIDALAVLRSTMGGESPIELSLIFAFNALEFGTNADKQDALSCLRRGKEKIADASPPQQDEAFRLMAFLANDLNGRSAALAIREELPARSFSDVVRAAVEAVIHLKAGDQAEANAAANSALQWITDETSLPLRLYVAQIMEQLGRFADALAILRPLANPENLDLVGQPALLAASRCGADDFVIDYTRSLRVAGRWDARTVELEVETLRRYRDYDRAVSVCREFIQRATHEIDRRFTRLRLSLIGLESGQPELIERDPDELPQVNEVQPRIGQLLCAVLEHGSTPSRAFEAAYELVRRHFTSHEVHLALCAAVGIGRPESISIPEPVTVAPGTAVRIHMDGAAAPRWLVLEDGPNPNPAMQEYPLDHPLCIELLGKEKGDRFVDRANPYQERNGVIEEVASKFLFRAWDSVARWTDLFPNVPFVFVFNLERPEGGRPDFAPILRTFEMQDQSEESLRNWYRDHPVSLLMMSVAFHRHPTQVIQYLAKYPDLPVRCCQGMLEEYDAGRRSAGEATLIADSSALSTLFVTTLWRQIARLPFKLVVTRSTLDEFLRLAEEQRHSSDEQLARRGDELGRVTLSPDESLQPIRVYEEFVEWVRSVAEVRTGVALASFSKTRRDEFTSLFGQAAAECIASALQDQVPLWTDDAIVPVLMQAGQPALRTWTQLVAERLRAEQCLTDDQFANLLVQLITCGYQHTQCTPHALLRAAEQSGWNPDHCPLCDVLRWLANRNINEDGVLGVVVGGLRLIWRYAPLVHQAEAVTRAIGRVLAGRPSGHDLIGGIASVTMRLFPLEPDVVAEQCRTVLLQSLDDRGEGGSPIIVLDG